MTYFNLIEIINPRKKFNIKFVITYLPSKVYKSLFDFSLNV